MTGVFKIIRSSFVQSAGCHVIFPEITRTFTTSSEHEIAGP